MDNQQIQLFILDGSLFVLTIAVLLLNKEVETIKSRMNEGITNVVKFVMKSRAKALKKVTKSTKKIK